MDSIEINRILMAVLLALLIATLSSMLADKLVSPKFLEKNVFIVEVAEEAVKGGAPVTEEKIEPIEPLLAAASIENGKDVAKKCLQCHTFEKDGPNRVGPNLWGVLGGKVGNHPGFAYSTVFKTKGGEWSFANLSEYLYKPQKFMPGTKMAFAGLKKTQDRADLIAYLRTLSDNPLPLPAK